MLNIKITNRETGEEATAEDVAKWHGLEYLLCVFVTDKIASVRGVNLGNIYDVKLNNRFSFTITNTGK